MDNGGGRGLTAAKPFYALTASCPARHG